MRGRDFIEENSVHTHTFRVPCETRIYVLIEKIIRNVVSDMKRHHHSSGRIDEHFRLRVVVKTKPAVRFASFSLSFSLPLFALNNWFMFIMLLLKRETLRNSRFREVIRKMGWTISFISFVSLILKTRVFNLQLAITRAIFYTRRISLNSLFAEKLYVKCFDAIFLSN